MTDVQITQTRQYVDDLSVPEQRLVVAAGVHLTYLVPVLSSIPEPRRREIVLVGRGAEADVLGLFLGQDDDRLQLALDTTHASPDTRGHTTFKAVLGGRSSLEFNGMIKILKDAQNSNDFLQQDSLMLSAEAKANAVPGLEIEANEVKASHGATAKPVDPEQKFYLMSRGLSERVAEAMVVTGFLTPLVKRIDAQEWQQRIFNALEHKFSLDLAYAPA